jgi:hypothetical protein
MDRLEAIMRSGEVSLEDEIAVQLLERAHALGELSTTIHRSPAGTESS